MAEPSIRPTPPGLLLQPFGWAAEAVLTMARAQPQFLNHLIEVTPIRLHAIALWRCCSASTLTSTRTSPTVGARPLKHKITD